MRQVDRNRVAPVSGIPRWVDQLCRSGIQPNEFPADSQGPPFWYAGNWTRVMEWPPLSAPLGGAVAAAQGVGGRVAFGRCRWRIRGRRESVGKWRALRAPKQVARPTFCWETHVVPKKRWASLTKRPSRVLPSLITCCSRPRCFLWPRRHTLLVSWTAGPKLPGRSPHYGDRFSDSWEHGLECGRLCERPNRRRNAD